MTLEEKLDEAHALLIKARRSRRLAHMEPAKRAVILADLRRARRAIRMAKCAVWMWARRP